MKSKLADRIVLVTAISVLVVGSAHAFVMNYPYHNCQQPFQPYSNDQYAWDSFQIDVEQYIECINQYVEDGNNTIAHIRNAQDDALSEARAFVNSLQ